MGISSRQKCKHVDAPVYRSDISCLDLDATLTHEVSWTGTHPARPLLRRYHERAVVRATCGFIHIASLRPGRGVVPRGGVATRGSGTDAGPLPRKPVRTQGADTATAVWFPLISPVFFFFFSSVCLCVSRLALLMDVVVRGVRSAWATRSERAEWPLGLFPRGPAYSSLPGARYVYKWVPGRGLGA